ncbi:uncharacterized protein LOC113224792 [Piliocolobus tephrosceles]|uniref:uncharacterized protein LOC113224792 n=1 Tax=Piliocolobus tephrosceles TaxID=591936 RepID=UPI000E6B0276|nr:uncharacterized protein LOC113224792 [Piliocolobus tephrosceles]
MVFVGGTSPCVSEDISARGFFPGRRGPLGQFPPSFGLGPSRRGSAGSAGRGGLFTPEERKQRLEARALGRGLSTEPGEARRASEVDAPRLFLRGWGCSGRPASGARDSACKEILVVRHAGTLPANRHEGEEVQAGPGMRLWELTRRRHHGLAFMSDRSAWAPCFPEPQFLCWRWSGETSRPPHEESAVIPILDMKKLKLRVCK